jgi:hypothetical protein
MQTDPHDFLIRLASTIAMALIPVVLIAVLSMLSCTTTSAARLRWSMHHRCT